MSNKTIFKRIALVTVAALGAGFLTITPASADNNASVGGDNVSPATGILNVATKASTTGDAVTDGDPSSATSLGLLANSTTLGVSSLSSTATMRADGEIVFYTQVAAGTSTDSFITFEIVGGYIDEQAGDLSAANEVLLSAGRDVMVVGDDDEGSVFQHSIGVKPNAGATSFTVSLYSNNLTSAQDTANSMADVLVTTLAGSTSKGSLIQRYTVTVAATSASGIYAASTSFVQGVAAAATAATSNVDETSSLTIDNAASSKAFISIRIRDAYSVDITSGALTISGTNGALIGYDGSQGEVTAANTSAVSNDAYGAITVVRPSSYANKAFTTTVTITFNGAVVGTKTVKFLGEVAKVTVTIDAIAQAGGSTTDNADIGTISYVDDAGNALLPQSGTSVRSTTVNGFVTNATITTLPTTADPVAYYGVACAGNATTASGTGSANLVFRHTNPFSGTNIDSAPVTVTCAGNTATYKASLDKAVYAPGEVATLTITGLDNAGKPANAIYNMQSTTSGSELTVTAPQMTAVTAISTSSVRLTSAAPGTKTYKFVVGNTEGSYNLILAIPKVNALLQGGANQTVAYKVAAAPTGAVTNAEVLAAIVKLIASINKQIRALQKSLRR